MRITVHYLAQIKRAAGVGTEMLDLEGPATLKQLLIALAARHTEAFGAMLAPKSLLFFVNDDHAELDRTLADGDDVSILAPMAGG